MNDGFVTVLVDQDDAAPAVSFQAFAPTFIEGFREHARSQGIELTKERLQELVAEGYAVYLAIRQMPLVTRDTPKPKAKPLEPTDAPNQVALDGEIES